MLAVLVLFSANTIKRNQDWSNDLVLWDKTVCQSPLSVRAHRNLGMVLRSQGRYAEAEPLFRRSLALWEKSLGPNHPIDATGLENLAEIYIAHGKPNEAKRLLERAEQVRAVQ